MAIIYKTSGLTQQIIKASLEEETKLGEFC